MADLERRRAGRPTRRQREKQAYRLVMAGGAAGAVFVVTGVLAIAGVMGWGIPLVALVVAVVCVLLFRRTTGA